MQFEHILLMSTARKLLGKEWDVKLKHYGLEDEMGKNSEQITSQGSSCGHGSRQQPDPSTWKSPWTNHCLQQEPQQ